MGAREGGWERAIEGGQKERGERESERVERGGQNMTGWELDGRKWSAIGGFGRVKRWKGESKREREDAERMGG